MSVEVVTIKRRTPLPLKGRPPQGQKELAFDMFDLIERIGRLREMASTITGASRINPEQFSIDKSDLVRAIGRLEADLRRRGVR